MLTRLLVTDSCYYVTGGQRSPNSSTYDATLIKFDTMGNILWKKNYYNDSSQTIDIRTRDFVETNQGNLATVGSRGGVGYFLLLDNDGEVIVKKIIIQEILLIT